VLSGVKRVVDEAGHPLFDQSQRESLERLIPSALAVQEGSAFVLRGARDAQVELDETTLEFIDALYALWLRLDDDAGSNGDEILYGEVGYWQHWWNVLKNGTVRVATPLSMNVMLPERSDFFAGQRSNDFDPAIVEHVFSQGLISMRLIVPPAIRGTNTETLVEEAIGRGVQVRVFASTSEFSIYDGENAVVRDERAPGHTERHRLTRRRAIVEPLSHLFEMRWAAAVPWESFVRGSAGMLQLMALGWTDRRIAEATGVSFRTVSRRIAEMMRASNVQSRFELGMKHALSELDPNLG